MTSLAPRSPADEIAALFVAARVLSRRLARPGSPAAAATLPRRLSRLARGLVRAAELQDPAFLGLLSLAEAQRDAPGRAALLALLALSAARELTTSRRALVRLALTVLVSDLAAAAHDEGSDARQAPARAAAAVMGLLGADPGALAVADATFDAAWLGASRTLGPLDRGEPGPAVAARILHVSRALLDRLAPADGSPARSPLEALIEVGGLRSVDPASYRCLVRALGVTPAGTVVELAGGDWAVVLPPARAEDPLDRPRLRLLTDGAGRARRPPVEIDLADAACQPYRIARLVDPAEARAYVAAAFLGG